MPNFPSLKNIQKVLNIKLKEPQKLNSWNKFGFTLFSELRGWIRWRYHESSDWFESAQTKSLLESSQPKNTAKRSYLKIAESNPKSPRWLSRLFNPRVLYPLSLLLHGPLTSPDRLKRYRNHTKYGTVSGSLWRRSSRLETSSSRPSYKGKSS